MSQISSNDTSFEKWLSTRLHRANCPSTLKLGEYMQGLLAEHDNTQLAEHLIDCPACRKEIAFWKEFLTEETGEQNIIDFTGVLRTIKRLVAILQQPATGVNRQPALGTLRGSISQQLTYNADDIQIFIDIQQDPAQSHLFVIHGLVIGLDTKSPMEVILMQMKKQIDQDAISEFGNFSFLSLAKGKYHLTLKSETLEVEIESLTIE